MEQPGKNQLLLIASGEAPGGVLRGSPLDSDTVHLLTGLMVLGPLPDPTEACTRSETGYGDIVGGREGQGQAFHFSIFTEISDFQFELISME